MASIIEVGIGLLLVYLLMSILVSQINNIIKARLNLRATYYQAELDRLLHDPVLRERILSHPSINMDEANENDIIKKITAEKLIDVLIDILAGDGETLEYLENLTNSPMVDQLLNRINNEDLKGRLEAVLATARQLDDARDKMIDWVQTGLNRASELYKRRMVFFSALVGALLAILLNVDTIYVAESLWNDPVLREATVMAATTTVEQVDVNTLTTDEVDTTTEEAQETVNQLLELRLPMGWYYNTLEDLPDDSPFRQDTRNIRTMLPGNTGWLRLLLIKVVGLTITTIAVMQGAPFWFDMLRRATGK